MSYAVRNDKAEGRVLRAFLVAAGLPAFVTAFLWVTSPHDITLAQGFAAYALLLLPWWAYHVWTKEKYKELPVFAMIGFMYWLYFAVPLFWGDHLSPRHNAAGQPLPEPAITDALLLAAAGLLALLVGMRLRVGRLLAPKRRPYLVETRGAMNYLRLVLAAGCAVSLYEPAFYVFGDEARQVMVIAQLVVPTVAFAILFRGYLRGTAERADKLLVAAFLGTRIMLALYLGQIEPAAAVVVMCTAIYIAERKKVPRLAILFLTAFVLFFQAGKDAHRQAYWHNAGEVGKLERIDNWLNESLTRWQHVFTDPTGGHFLEVANLSLSRVSLLTQAANVLELTPSSVPHQGLKPYSYVGVTLIPRVVWPDKPSINEANTWYQTAYGIVYEGSAVDVSVSVGVLVEAYIGFGWYGAVVVMFLLGVFFDSFQKTFLSESSGTLFWSVGVVLLPNFMLIESQMSVYVGGLVQQVVLITLALLPVIRWSKPRARLSPLAGYKSETVTL